MYRNRHRNGWTGLLIGGGLDIGGGDRRLCRGILGLCGYFFKVRHSNFIVVFFELFANRRIFIVCHVS